MKSRLLQIKTSLLQIKSRLLQIKTSLLQIKNRLLQIKTSLLQIKDRLLQIKTSLLQIRSRLLQIRIRLLEIRIRLLEIKKCHLMRTIAGGKRPKTHGNGNRTRLLLRSALPTAMGRKVEKPRRNATASEQHSCADREVSRSKGSCLVHLCRLRKMPGADAHLGTGHGHARSRPPACHAGGRGFGPRRPRQMRSHSLAASIGGVSCFQRRDKEIGVHKVRHKVGVFRGRETHQITHQNANVPREPRGCFTAREARAARLKARSERMRA